MKQNQVLTGQKDEKLTARRKSYVSYIERYPLYSTLLVLKDYEDEEYYEECAIIRDAITEYREKYASKLPKDLMFPISVSQYKNKSHQSLMNRLGLVVEENTAKEKATLIKLNLPLT